MNRGYVPSGDDDQAAMDAAATAQATADNARQMVLNRDPRLATVEANTVTLAQLAADYQTQLGASIQDRASIHAALDALAARTTDIRYRDGISVPAVTILNLGTAAIDVTVTWDTPMPDANYLVIPQIATSSALLIGKATPVVKSKTKDAAVITVTTTSLLTVGALTLSAIAVRKT